MNDDLFLDGFDLASPKEAPMIDTENLRARANTCYLDGRYSTGQMLESAANEIDRFKYERRGMWDELRARNAEIDRLKAKVKSLQESGPSPSFIDAEGEWTLAGAGSIGRDWKTFTYRIVRYS